MLWKFAEDKNCSFDRWIYRGRVECCANCRRLAKSNRNRYQKCSGNIKHRHWRENIKKFSHADIRKKRSGKFDSLCWSNMTLLVGQMKDEKFSAGKNSANSQHLQREHRNVSKRFLLRTFNHPRSSLKCGVQLEFSCEWIELLWGRPHIT